MKSKKECLLFFEFLKEEFKDLTFINIKDRYRNLTLRYNTDNGTEKNKDKHLELIEVFKLLKVYYQQKDETPENIEIESKEVDLIQELGGIYPGQIYAIDYKNNLSCLIWSPNWRSETLNRFEIGIIGYAFCTEIKFIRYNIVPLINKPKLIASKIPTNSNQSTIESILVSNGIKLMTKMKNLESDNKVEDKEVTKQINFEF